MISTTVIPHLGLLSLVAVLRNKGIGASIFDPKILFAEALLPAADESFFQRCAIALLSMKPKVIGFTAYGRSLRFAIGIAEIVRRRDPEIAMLLGGPHPTILGGKILEAYGCFDGVVRYEAETVIEAVVQSYGSGKIPDNIPGIVIRKSARTVECEGRPLLPDLNALPQLPFDIYPIDEIGMEELPIEAGRGCPFDCSFCSTAGFFSRKYRVKSVDRLVAEIATATSSFGIRRFTLNHDLFGLDRKYVRSFSEAILPNEVDWSCSMRVDTATIELFPAMREAGCSDIYFGIESGSSRMQTEIKKRLKLSGVGELVKKLGEAGIRGTFSFITGFPTENESDQNDTLDLIGDIVSASGHAAEVQLHLLSPEPGSGLLAEYAEKLKYDEIGPEFESLAGFPDARIHREIFSIYHYFPSNVGRKRSLLASAFINEYIPSRGWRNVLLECRGRYRGRLSEMFSKLTLGYNNHNLHSIDDARDLLLR